jgi:hypothetical protein
MMQDSFKAVDIVNHFKSLKQSITEENWWNGYISIEWNKIRPGKNSTKWLTFKYTPDVSIKSKRLSVIIRDEIHSGQIMPNTQEDVIELKTKFPESKIELRTMKPSIQFQKWSKQVPTQEDRISPVIDENGNRVVPGDEYLSIYYQLATFIDEIFRYEMNIRIERGSFLMMYLSQNKECTAKDARDYIKHINECDTIITDDQANTIRSRYPSKYIDVLKGILVVSSTKIGTIIQERISDKAVNNKGAMLPNPMTRITIPFDPKSGEPMSVTILDKNKPFKCGPKKGYEIATYKNQPINANNIHWFIPSRSVIDGIISMDSICFSQLGVSLPIKATLLVVQQPVKRENNLFSMCQEIYGENTSEYDEDNVSVSSSMFTNINDKKEIITDSLLNDLSV